MRQLFLFSAAALLALPALAQRPTSPQLLAPAEVPAGPGPAAPVLTYADQMPAYPGGEGALHQYLLQKTEYPALAKRQGLSGTVVVQFVVDEQGRLLDPQVVRSSEPAFDAEALRLVRLMPWWTPGRQQDQLVRVRCTLPIQFTFRR